jgi:PKD repeat protein
MDMDRLFGRTVALSRPRSIVPPWTIALGMAAVVLLAIPVVGRASSDAVDQSLPATTIPSVINSTKVMAQTFTAGTTGQIDKLSLSLEGHSNLVTGWLEIRAVGTGGTPAGGTQQPTSTPIQFSYAFGNTPHDFTINPAVPVTAGTQYAIVWTTKVGTAYWWGTGFNAYTGGQQWLACIGCGWTASPTRDFAFATWVSTVTNQPATVAADHPAVAVNEGTAAANIGTYSDPNGDTVAITASSGTVTKTGTSGGTWSWHAPAADEGGAHTITITADDGNGGASTTSFPVSVGGVAPVAHFTTPGSTAPEGTAVLLAGSATSPSAADNAAGFIYGWTVTKNGNAYKSGTGAHWQFTPDDEGTFVVTMKATDDGNMSDTATATVTGTNVWPTAQIAGYTTTVPLFITLQQTVNFTGSFSDPSALDTHTTKWNFGDGTSSSGLSTSHSYTTAGNYHVSLTVTDDDGGVGVATTTVSVLSPQDALGRIGGEVQKISTLTKGQKNSLIAKLDAASASAARGNNIASHNQMSAFLNEVQADVKTGKITNVEQIKLTGAIHAVEAAIGTYNRMLQWWPLEP